MIKMLSGNEAVARGMWEAGVEFASAYPGTPSTEILENYALFPNVYAEWATNEKVAVDAAVGAAYAGHRAIAVMKHVGLNVAADSFMYASMTGMEAGLVIVSADDPAMHSSQNEQDNRTFAKFGRVPCLEPSDSQEARDMTIAAFSMSERFDTPVLLRLTTRICHSMSSVELGERREATAQAKPFPRNPAKYAMVPGNAVKHHPLIEQRVKDIAMMAESFPFNRLEKGLRKLGIITSGVSYQYAKEVFPKAAVLKLGMSWPLSEQMIRDFAASVERLIVIEELDPFIEEAVKLMGIACEGKSIFPLFGEFDPRVVRESAIEAGLLPKSAHIARPKMEMGTLPARPPVLCPGCPYRPTFYILNKLRVPVNGDIGCYTLGLMAPLNAIHTCGCMGAGIGVAYGATKAGSPEKHVAVIGDSTFFHSGISPLISAVYNQAPIITIILDNRITGMTGHQQNPGTGRTLLEKKTVLVELEPLVRSCGVSHVKTLHSLDVQSIEKTLKEFIQLDEPSVLIVTEPCTLLPDQRKKWVPLEVLAENCNGCGLCFRIGCPAILKSEQLDEKYQRPKALIEPALCTGCEVCAQICPRDAIPFKPAGTE
jgi:indolepyruvate ferredoxin oxidoreductase, alpha subunit